MSYSNSFPTQRPSLNLVFNGGSDQLDSRLSYSRSSSGTAFSAERHKSSENLLPYSSDLSNAAWTKSEVTVPSNNNSSPDGGTAASSVLETATTGGHSLYDDFACVSGDSYTCTLFAKANGRSVLRVSVKATATIASIDYDLTAVSSTVASGSADSHSITAIGSTGWYKLSLTVTATATGTGRARVYLHDGSSTSYAGDATKGAYLWGCQVSSTGETVLNETSGSIHRSFAPTLKSYSSDQPRFEYSATDGQSAGTALGLLVESQATNLARYGSSFDNWTNKNRVDLTGNASVSPDGTLSAMHAVATSVPGTHTLYDSWPSITNGTTYTASVYAKDAGQRYVQIAGSGSNFGTAQYATFDLQTGSVDANGVTASASQCGNGWYRIQATMTATATGTANAIISLATTAASSRVPSFTGDDYSGVLLFGYQFEANSSASSLVNTGSQNSALTRAADSCSLVSAPLLDNGSGGLTVEYDMRNASSTSYVLQTARSVSGTTQDGVTIFQEGLLVNGQGSNTRIGATTSNVFHKATASWESGSQKISRDGSAVTEDTTTVVPQSGTDTLHIGTRQDGNACINGHIRNIAIFAEPLTSTNLTTLSQL